jgi:hypothetical protein
MIKRNRALAFLAMLVMALVSCAMQAQTEADLTPLQKAQKTATWMMDTYSAQYDDYKATVTRTDLNEEQKKILRAKYVILQEAAPLIRVFTQTVADGGVPSPETETQIMDLLTRLQTMTTKQEERP